MSTLDDGAALIALADDAIAVLADPRVQWDNYTVGQWVLDTCHALARDTNVSLTAAASALRADLGL